MDRKIEMWGDMYQMLLPFIHFFSVPAFHGILVNRQRLVRNYKFFADAQYFAEAFANRACSVGVVEIEHQIAWFAKFHAVSHEPLGKLMFMNSVFSPDLYNTFIVSFVISGFNRISQTGNLVFIVRN